MVRAKPKVKEELLSPSERSDLESQKKELEKTLEQAEGYGNGTQAEGLDKGAIKRQISHLDNAINQRTPGTVLGAEKDALAKEEKELERLIKEGMPTDYEMRQPSKNPGAVRKHMDWSARNINRIERYRTIQRMLRPNDPKSIENLRKDR